MKKGVAALFAAVAFLLGLAFGFLCAPVKKGIFVSGGNMSITNSKVDSPSEPDGSDLN